MRACKFHNVKKHCHWHPLVFEMNRNRHVCLVVWGCPSVGCEAQCPFVFLQWSNVSNTTSDTYVMVLTCNIFAIHIRTLMNAFRTSRETVSAEGRWYSGLPVFIRLRKPRSVTILKDRLFSETQRTISALQVAKKSGGTRSFQGMFLTLLQLKYVDGANRSPCLSQYVQTRP
jgi:hypothetical protein